MGLRGVGRLLHWGPRAAQQLGEEVAEPAHSGGCWLWGQAWAGHDAVQLLTVHTEAKGGGPKGHLADVQTGHGARGGTQHISDEARALHPVPQPFQGAVTAPGVTEEKEAAREEAGLECGPGKHGEVVAIEMQSEEALEVLEGDLLHEGDPVAIQVEQLELGQVGKPGRRHAAQ